MNASTSIRGLQCLWLSQSEPSDYDAPNASAQSIEHARVLCVVRANSWIQCSECTMPNYVDSKTYVKKKELLWFHAFCIREARDRSPVDPQLWVSKQFDTS